ncbi:hypothetical protein J7T55_001268 [Diaporthe amygdali]|uniref:uncharacterized protein n=1 Tax=Phomopsis amygdali TaxID=1214568 RepID=UPI0022FE9DEC|nr:uncharacterized protein J7T55_001268 [Diaporthe amygdali]KAJ0106744.1 hypothetical protein J7T55_001268 [Diaporthe amygdali]
MQPFTHSRPLGNLEVFFKKLADLGVTLEREHWAVHLALSLRVSDTINLSPYLQRAWQEVRRHYPAIGSIICPAQEVGVEEECDVLKREILTLPVCEAALWSEDTFFVHDNEKNADSLFCCLRPKPTATCHWLPQSSQVVIRSSHWRLDGIGMAKLGHVFLAKLAEVLRIEPGNVSLGVSTTNLPTNQPLPHSIENLARIWIDKQSAEATTLQDQSSAHTLRLEAGADALVGEFLRGVPSIGLPTRTNSATVPPGASQRVETRLSVSETGEITEARRAKNLSFTGTVHAAIVRVTARFPQHSLAESYAAFFPVDLRQSIVSAGAASEDQLMIGLYFSGLPICVGGVVPGEDGEAKAFEEIAREMTAVYNRDLTAFWKGPDGKQVSLMELAEPYLQRTTVLFNTPVPDGHPLIQTPDLSGLGKFETYLKRDYQSLSDPLAPKVEVADVWIGTEMLNRCVQFHVWSWRDELRLGASFNQSFYEKSFVVELLDQIMEELFRGLEIRGHH